MPYPFTVKGTAGLVEDILHYLRTTCKNLLKSYLLGRPTLVGKALSFTHEISFFLSYQSIVLSSHTVDGHQMYFGGSVVDKASTVGIGISPTLS